MLKKILRFYVGCGLVVQVSLAGAAPVSQQDRLTDLIRRVEDSAKLDRIAQLENRLQGKASWKIQCELKSV